MAPKSHDRDGGGAQGVAPKSHDRDGGGGGARSGSKV